ncbi:MAG: type IX secretion system protein PorQ [Chitinophagales bacterium]|nr:type IX secretion system protein PorQ [Chitinophagales bacterium]
MYLTYNRHLLLSLFACVFYVLLSKSSHAQLGGSEVFLFMNEAPSARITSMGGTFISVHDEDLSIGFQNPAMLNPSMNNRLSLNYVDYISDIKRGYTGYVRTVAKWKTTFNGGIQFVNYGQFTATDQVGNVSGQFDGAEYAVSIGAGREYIKRFSYGANLTYITSRLESYHSSGIALTVAGAYYDSAQGFTATILFKNVGTQFQPYAGSGKEPLPFDIQAGISKRLIHTPFLFSIVFHDLYRWDLRYNDPNQADQGTILIDSSQQAKEKNYFVDNFFLHTIIGTEINFGKNFRVSIAYNHQRREELAVELRKALSGFSFGAGVRINRFNIGYGRAIYNVAGGVNHLTFGVNLDELFGKKM